MTPGRLLRHCVLLILSACTAPLLAQEQPLPFEGPAAERIEQYKKIRLMDFLKLDEETSVRFFSRYNRFREELNALNDRKNDSIDELETLVRRDAAKGEYQRVFDQLDAMGTELTVLRRQYLDDLSALLPPKKVASYIAFERNFYRNLRDLLRETQKERSGRAPR